MNRIALVGLIAIMPVFAQQPKFELADVHVSPTAPRFAQNFGGVLREGRYVNRDATMIQLIIAAYGVTEDTISGGPGWVVSDLFDVVAKVPDETTPVTANLMLQGLLEERFNLVTRRGIAPVPRFVLSPGKGASKLKPASGGSPGCQQQPQSGGARGNDPASPASQPNQKVTCRNLTSAAIAQNLRQMANGYLDHDVIDQTNLEGSWDFDIEWTGRGALAAKGADGISIFDAVEKQLGLKLEPQNVPLPSLAIESVNRKPSANPPGVATALPLAAARFEVATIKPQNPDQPMRGLIYTGGSQMRSGGTLRSLISMALQITPNIAADMVVGLPKSADSQAWDITAKVPSTGEGAPNVVGGRPQPPPLSVGLEMLRNLLVDQFQLKTHTENREVTVYALTLAGSKSKMTQAEESERVGCKPDPTAPKPAPNVQAMLACKNMTMAELADEIQQRANAYIDHPVVDATGLEGGWNFVMGWTARGVLQGQSTPNPNAQPGALGDASDPSGGLSVFDAMEKELGLKLVKQKRSIPVIVVDHVSEKPIE